jgi:maltooligosyltrehalose trehalohydrolase
LTGELEGYYSDFGSLADVGTAMTRPFVYAGRHSGYRQRRHGRAPLGVSASKFIAYLQNHDQLGNRARGERLSHLVGLDRAKMGAALILLSPYVPMLFQGEEWGASAPFQYFVDFRAEPQLARAVAEGRQKEFSAFGWQPCDIADPTDIESFAKSKIDWSEINSTPHSQLLAWHQRLIKLRGQISAFTDGRLDLVEVRCDEDCQWIIVERGPVSIVCNFSDEAQEIPVQDVLQQHLLLTSKDFVLVNRNGFFVPAETAAICLKTDSNPVERSEEEHIAQRNSAGVLTRKKMPAGT